MNLKNYLISILCTLGDQIGNKNYKKKYSLIKKKLNDIIYNFPYLHKMKLYIKFVLYTKGNLKKQLQDPPLFTIDKHKDLNKNIFIPLIETSHYQYHQILILAKALEKRGANLTILICDSFLKGCEIKSVKNENSKDPCLNCKFNRSNLVPMYNLNTIKLSSLFNLEELSSIQKSSEKIINSSSSTFHYGDEDITQIINDSITRYYYGNTPKNKKQKAKVTLDHIFTTIVGFLAAKKIEKKFQPNIILNSMTVYSSWRPYMQYFEKNESVKLFHIAINQFNFNSIILNTMELYKSNSRYYSYIKSRKSKSLIQSEKKELDNFLNKRISGESKIFKELNFFSDNSIKEINNLKIDENKNNLFLFSNIFWDIGISDCDSLYNSIIDWVLDSIRIVSLNSSCHLYIKLHPGETFDTAKSIKGVREYIYEKFPVLPKNITIITPELKINTYELFPFIDTAIVFNGTIGLEALFKNIPVVISGEAPYGNLKLVNEPKNVSEYEQMLTGSKKLIIPKRDTLELFAYFYFIKTCIPWNLTQSAYGDNFNGFTFENLEDISPGKNKYLDHLCNSILTPEETTIENW